MPMTKYQADAVFKQRLERLIEQVEEWFKKDEELTFNRRPQDFESHVQLEKEKAEHLEKRKHLGNELFVLVHKRERRV